MYVLELQELLIESIGGTMRSVGGTQSPLVLLHRFSLKILKQKRSFDLDDQRGTLSFSKDGEDEEEEPEEVKQAWDELLLIQREQQRYSDIKYDLEQDLERCKKKQTKLEDVSYFLVST